MADGTITLNSRTASLLVASAMFAHEIITSAASANTGPLLEAAERYGLCDRRQPYDDEKADPDWYGNYLPITDVPEVSPDFAELIAALEDTVTGDAK